MAWRIRSALFAVVVLLLTLFPPAKLHEASACPPDGGEVPAGVAYAAAPPINHPGLVPDAASKNHRTFGRHVGHEYVGDPVDVVSGAYSFTTGAELRVPSHGLDFALSRTYNSADDFSPSPIGPGWVHSYDWEYWQDWGDPIGSGILRRGDGRRGVQPDDISFTYSAATNAFTLVTHDHTAYTFGSSYERGFNCFGGTVLLTFVLTSITSAAGDRMTLTWSPRVLVGTAPSTSGGYAEVLLSVADTQGRTYTFGYDGRYDLASVTDPFGRRLIFTHNASDQLLSATDLGGRTTTYAYEAATRHIISVTDPDGRVRPTNSYAANGAVTSQTDGVGNLTTFAITPYVSSSVTDPRGTTSTYTSNTCGWLTKQTVTGGSTYTWRQAFSGACDRTQSVDPLGNTTDFGYDASHDLVSRTDPLVAGGRPTTSYQYDAKKNLTRITDPRGFTTDHAYDGTTSALLTLRRQIDATTYATTTYAYGDAVNRLRPTTVTSPRGYATSLAYDANGNLTLIQDPDGVATTFGYDAFGRRTSVTDAENHATTITYDATGQVTAVTDPLGHATRYASDGAGNTTAVTDRNGNLTEYVYDREARVVGVKQHPDPITTYTTSLSLDSNGNVARVTEGNGTYCDFAYDGLNALTSATESTSQGLLTTTFARDGNGNKTSRRTPDGVTVAYGYDGLGRLTSVNASGVSITYGYDLASDLTSMVDSTGTTTFSYDGARKPIAVNGPVNSLTYSFDLDGYRTRVGYPLGDVAYAYTAAGRLATVTDWSVRVSRYTYSPSGRVASLVYPNGMSASYTYDAAGRLVQLINAVGATTITSHAYTLDPEGNRTSLTEFVSGLSAPGTTDSFTYAYDGLSRLRAVSGPLPESFAYDGASNVTTRSGPAATFSYDGADRVQSDGMRAFAWSLADRVIARGADSFTYDAFDRLTSATAGGAAATYAYAGDGLLAVRNGVPYLWDRSAGIAPLVQVGGDAVIHGLGALYVVHGDATITALALDAMGSVRAEVTGNGLVTASRRYRAYGATAQSSGTHTSPLGFAGELTDDVGLVYLRARWYDPDAGRFLTADPAAGSVTRAELFNRFAYAAGRPTLLTDPSGACEDPLGADEAECAGPGGGSGAVGGGGGGPTGFETPNSTTLGRNLTNGGAPKAPGDHAHHIVAGSDPRAAAARDVLQKAGIEINSAENGIFLRGEVHRSLHTNEYYRAVTDVLAATGGTKDAVIQALRGIAEAIIQGIFPH